MTALIKQEDHTDLKYFKDLCKTCMASGKYGADMNEATMLNIMLTARDLGISPLKAINGGFYIVNGKISMAATLMIDRIRNAGHSISILEWTKEKCIIIGKRRDNGDTCKLEYTIEDAQLAGLTNSPTWKKHPKSMLSARAHSMLARVLFPDVVGNAYSEDEAHEIQGIPPGKRPDVDPDAITVEAVDMETGEIIRTVEELHAETGIGSIEDVREFVKFIAIAKKCSEDEVVLQMLSTKETLESFKEKLAKRIEKKFNNSTDKLTKMDDLKSDQS